MEKILECFTSIFFIAFVFSIVLFFCIGDIVSNKKNEKPIFIILLASLCFSSVGYTFNQVAITSNGNKMPSLEYGQLKSTEQHKIIDKNTKKFYLCDIFHMKRFMFIKNIVLSVGDIIIFVGLIIFITTILTVIFLAFKKYNC